MSDSSALVAKLWNYCHVLRDDGLLYGVLRRAVNISAVLEDGGRAKAGAPFNRPAVVPGGLDWPSLLRLDGDEL